MPQAGFDPPGEKWQLGLNIVVALPPKPPRLDCLTLLSTCKITNDVIFCSSLSAEPDTFAGPCGSDNSLGTMSFRCRNYTTFATRYSNLVALIRDESDHSAPSCSHTTTPSILERHMDSALFYRYNNHSCSPLNRSILTGSDGRSSGTWHNT